MLRIIFVVSAAIVACASAQDVIIDPILPPPILPPPVLPPPVLPPPIVSPPICPLQVLPPPVLQLPVLPLPIVPPPVLPPPILPPPIVPPPICPPPILPPPVCGINEVYLRQGVAPNCDAVCTQIGMPCNQYNIFPPFGCYCLPGYARDLNNICVPITQCSIGCANNPYAYPF